MFKGFLKSAAVLAGGNILAQLVTLLISPLLTRAFSVDDFAAYALYSSALGIVSQVVCLKLDMAISLVREDDEAANLFHLSLLATLLLTLLSGMLLPLARPVGWLLQTDDMGWLGLIPLSVAGSGLLTAFSAVAVRGDHFGHITAATALRVSVMAALQMGFGALGYTRMALPLGQALSYFPALLPLLPTARQLLSGGRATPVSLRDTARRNLSFPGYTAVGSAFNSGAYHLTSFLVSALFSSAMLGYYSLCVRVLSVPLNLVASPVSQVYMRHLSRCGDGEEGRAFCLWISAGLSALALVGALILLPLSGWGIPFAFGGQWAEAVPLFRMLLPLYAVRFALVPVSGTAIVLGRRRQTMVWQMGMAALSLLPALFFRRHTQDFLAAMTLSFSAGYIGFYRYSLGLFGQKGRVEVRHG